MAFARDVKIQLFEFETHRSAFRRLAKEEAVEEAMEGAVAAAARGEASSARPAEAVARALGADRNRCFTEA